MSRDTDVSSRKDKANFKWKSEREETFCLKEISEKKSRNLSREHAADFEGSLNGEE
jgi:hypothetical protein